MFQFEKLSVNQILVFSEIVSNSSLMQQEFIEKDYLRQALNFGETIEFLQKLDLIEIIENRITVKPNYGKFLEDLKEEQKLRERTKSFIINALINKKTLFSEYINDFFSNFRLKDKHYDFAPSASERLEYSGLRNFLIDLEFLYLDSSEKKYIIAEEYWHAFSELKRQKKLSPDEFLKIQRSKEEIGREAEFKIIEYEKGRLFKFPNLVEKIEHISLKDVTAGYDIKSFEVTIDEKDNIAPRFIEVKAVSPGNYKFNWTRNEIEKSKFYRQNYYLYLLPVMGKNNFDFESLKVIRDPYFKIYKNKNGWICTYELLTFSLSNESKEDNSNNM